MSHVVRGTVVTAGGGAGAADSTAANQATEIAAINKLNAQLADYDTGAGTASTAMLGIAIPRSGGPVGVSTSNPLPVITILTAIAPAAATVGTSSAEALATNTNRKTVDLVNTNDTKTIYLGVGFTAVVGSGITLFPYASVRLQTTQAINAISSGASTNLAIQEWT